MTKMSTHDAEPSTDFIRRIIAEDHASGRLRGVVKTRFPPEPNGYLHIGHAKSICLNFTIAAENPGGVCHLRFDDTNPTTEEIEYEESIKHDIRWLGFDWGEHLYYASGYFDRLYDCAVALIRMGNAYVDSLSADEIRAYRGTLTEPGRNSPHRDRSIDENLELFLRMKRGDFEEGAHVLRAKIDMASPNVNMRDPTLYRIRKAHHHRTGDAWCIYPMYDFAHGLSDAFEGITHSLCTLEFEDHRPLYDWFLDVLATECHPQQIEFSRLNVTYMTTSKRKLRSLVEGGIVRGWDDPRMPTIAGLRRRGYTAEAIRRFCARVGIAKREHVVEIALLEHTLREDLNRVAPRVMGVLRPLKVVIENYPEGRTEELDAVNNPEDPAAGRRKVPFGREILIERDDFMEEPPKSFFRLAPGREVRLRWAYLVTCTSVVRDAKGEIAELRCRYDPATRGGDAPDGRKPKGTIHWVSAQHAIPAEVRLYDRLFREENPGSGGGELIEDVNPDSLEVIEAARVEPTLRGAAPGTTVQFERLGYFCVDPDSVSARTLVFNRTVTLRDTWAKIAAREAATT